MAPLASSFADPYPIRCVLSAREPADAAATMRAVAAAHPRQVILMDWDAYGASHPALFADDGLHVGQSGARAYADFIRRGADPMMPPSATRLRLPLTESGATPCGTVRGRRTRVFVVRGVQRITCGRARELARRSPLRPIAGWRPYAWGLARGAPWTAVYRRDDGRVLVATRDAVGYLRRR